MSRFIEIVEVGPRDGLQNEKTVLDVGQKLDFIRRLDAAGARRMEVVSFVNPNRVPQMAGAEEVMADLSPDTRLSRIGLVLNMRGWERAVASGCDEANVVVCASDGFGIRNQGASVDEQIAAMHGIAERRATGGGPPISVTFSVAFGCPFDGEVPEDRVVSLAREAANAKVAEIALADTIGVADPWTVRRRVEAVRAVIGDTPLRLHFHDTRNTGLANAFAGVEAGVSILDASCGGLGGCPFAPEATGNIGTEDLVYMLERAGFETGYDLGALIETAKWMSGVLNKPIAASVSRAGVFPQ
ncbi:hydroxymethylglutaryl-CoA lyase [Phenylobacterium sp.]|uniref:hydroxymethylglutaryl-CoA lyase n=1 Tax=Phenylobacterium sp. TaxID=1871053 RepID=UPI002733A226|nr:hydroxymethylglutaryl-CoA lyase [Phenylobacterium sp.]MDP3592306.1 hydroxymethylglutaryl-CoA lyase [Phenylobacterium sp.]